MRASAPRSAALALCALLLFACAGKRPAHLGVNSGSLAPCPGSPNCVSSDAEDPDRRVEPLFLAVPASEAWPTVVRTVSELPGATVVKQDERYLHAEARSRIFGFTDDLELHLRPEAGVLAVRSASRVGYWDLGVNRRRVALLRSRLQDAGVVRRGKSGNYP